LRSSSDVFWFRTSHPQLPKGFLDRFSLGLVPFPEIKARLLSRGVMAATGPVARGVFLFSLGGPFLSFSLNPYGFCLSFSFLVVPP